VTQRNGTEPLAKQAVSAWMTAWTRQYEERMSDVDSSSSRGWSD
jgi:hypothetical protein